VSTETDGFRKEDRIAADILAAAERESAGLHVAPKDCEKLASMLDVHVRPVYYKAANRKGDDRAAERAMGASMLADCDRLADAFHAASTLEDSDA